MSYQHAQKGTPIRAIMGIFAVVMLIVETRWFYGWGIRLTSRGWLWNTSGFDAVELTYLNGKRFIIGKDDPIGLAAEIQGAIGE